MLPSFIFSPCHGVSPCYGVIHISAFGNYFESGSSRMLELGEAKKFGLLPSFIAQHSLTNRVTGEAIKC